MGSEGRARRPPPSVDSLSVMWSADTLKVMRTVFAVFVSLGSAFAILSCVPPAIVGGPTGPAWCPNGTVYGDAGDMCCPAGAAVDQYGVCEDMPSPVEPSWQDLAKRNRADAGHD